MTDSLQNAAANIGTTLHREVSGWSGLTINEQGTQFCPLCGADQTGPAPIAKPSSQDSTPQDWWAAVLVILVGIGCLAGILWFELASPRFDPASATAEIAAKSLRDIREMLSSLYAGP
jgi:hypothetical protein